MKNIKTDEDEAFEAIEKAQALRKNQTDEGVERKRVLFPTMLRKMWSGSEVQAWLDEHVNKENT